MDEASKIFLIRIVLFAIYLNVGAGIFMLIEGKGNGETQYDTKYEDVLQRYGIDTTSQLNMTEGEFLNLIANIIKATSHSNTTSANDGWGYFQAIYFATHLLTTIGYGNVTPVTPTGQIVTIFYALIGIPLCLLTLKAMGANYNHAISKLLECIEKKCLKRDQVKNADLKVMLFNIFIAMTFLFVVSVQTHFTENWTYVQSVYAWFITMTTVGFGDYIPKHAEPFPILIGLSLMSAVLDAVGCLMEKTDFKKLLLCGNHCGRITAPRDQDDSSANQGYDMEGSGAGFKDVACQTNVACQANLIDQIVT